MKKLIAMAGVLALAACGGDGADTAVIEDTTVLAPATEPAPVTTYPETTAPDTMMVTDPAMTDTMMVDTVGGTTGM